MNLEHSFTVPVGVDEAWKILLDIERIGPCMPGATIDSVDGDDFTGSVKVKLGPIGLTYKGKASFVEKDEAAHRAVIDARGKDARGNGTASAKVTATLSDEGGATKVLVNTDLDITGKPAQFGRGVMVDVGNKLIGQFADSLAEEISSSDTPSSAEATAGPGPGSAGPTPTAAVDESAVKSTAGSSEFSAPSASSAPSNGNPSGTSSAPAAPRPSAAQSPKPKREAEAINLFESAGPAVIKRVAPLVAVLALVLAIVWWRKKR